MKKRVFSAVQPSGDLTIGNYLGAVSQFSKLQDEYDCMFSVANMHSITVDRPPELLREKTYEMVAIYLAEGIDLEKSIVFIQSDCPEHAELCWVLNSITYMGQLSRMTQFKDKAKKHSDNINSALFTYPVLMAADILLYKTNLVPVGDDQKQHMEITRDLAIRFNNKYGDTFIVPEALYSNNATRIMSLQDPTVKMSKSDPDENATIKMLDEPKTIIKKVKRAVTDSIGEVNYCDEQAGLKNLLDIYSAFRGESPEKIAEEYKGSGYGKLKGDLGELIAETLTPVRERYNEFISDKAEIRNICKKGAEKASAIASEMLKDVYSKVGLNI